MESKYRIELLLDRSRNDLMLAEAVSIISQDKTQKSSLNLPEESTFYSNVISLAYYSIFYSAKAFLFSKNISTSPPHEHRKVEDNLKILARNGEIDFDLLRVFEE